MATPAPKAKGGLAAMLGAPSKGKPSVEAEESEETSAARDVIDAVKAGDAEMLSMALKHHYELCKSADDGEGGDEERY